MAVAQSQCTHSDQIKDVKPSAETCEECVKAGTHPVQLRLCLTCGHVACCDSSVGRHARKHFEQSGHPIIQSFKSAPPGGTEWRFCYVDNDYL